jgi:hypothetical protein
MVCGILKFVGQHRIDDLKDGVNWKIIFKKCMDHLFRFFVVTGKRETEIDLGLSFFVHATERPRPGNPE